MQKLIENESLNDGLMNGESLNPYRTTDVLIFNVLNMDRKTREIGPLNGISLPDIHMDL